jgi:hypothetical protein
LYNPSAFDTFLGVNLDKDVDILSFSRIFFIVFCLSGETKEVSIEVFGIEGFEIKMLSLALYLF